jgi:hypothetical protein
MKTTALTQLALAAATLASLLLAGARTSIAAEPVLEAAGRRAVFDAPSGRITFSSRIGDRFVPRASASFEGLDRFVACKSLPARQSTGPAVAVYGPADRWEFTVLIAPDGRFQVNPGASGRIVLRDARIEYALAPSLVGTDLVYSAKADAEAERLYVPSLGMLVGLLAGGDGMLVGVWRPGKQVVSLHRGQIEGKPVFDGLAMDLGGESLFLGWIEHSRVWHVEPLKPAYLEKYTPIDWRRPFEAKWIGRFFIASEDVSYPFYFRHEKVRLWGRWIRGWFYYPMEFDGDQTVVHFEKNFPPKGDLLIYFLEEHPSPARASADGSPIGWMRKALGEETARKILDFEGVEERLLLKHGNAVCAMTNTMQEWFDKGEIAPHRKQIESWCRDVADFIGMIRQRVFEFDAYSKSMRTFLAERARAEPALADVKASLASILDEMDELVKNGMPKASLEEVRAWTDTMNRLADTGGPDSAKAYGKLGGQCRSVAGSQDDLCRDLSVRVLRIAEEAARLGVQSPRHVRLAEDVIARGRRVLRKPTWWEPRRHYLPKSDPGRP